MIRWFFFTISLFPLPLSAAATLDEQLRILIQNENLTGKPLLKGTPVDINSDIAKLGKRLFFATELSGQRDTACVSCHHPLLGGGDNLALPIGVDAIDPKTIGPGRKHSPQGFDFDGGPNVPRNAQTTFNTIFYSRCMFWDCRVESLGATPGMNGRDGSVMRTPDTMWGMPSSPASSLLHAQAGFPVIAEDEMRAHFMQDRHGDEVREALTQRLRDNPAKWQDDFQKVFKNQSSADNLITFERITQAIAAYEESQIFINNTWRAYVEGNSQALSERAKRGALLFYRRSDQGGFACADCHRGDFFTDEKFHVMVIPQIGRGTADGEHEDHDYGRYLQTGNVEDKFAFRTPSLLNVEVTAPYGHSGAYHNLRDVIRHMINPPETVTDYQYQLGTELQRKRSKENTMVVLRHYRQLQNAKNQRTKKSSPTKTQIDQLYAFLLSLTDPCVKSRECMSPWIDHSDFVHRVTR